MTTQRSSQARAPLLRVHRADGFALPITLFVVTLVTLMLSTVFVRVQIDRRIGESSGDIVDALTAAQSGLNSYLGTVNYDVNGCWRALRPPDGDSVRINVNGGYADVVAHVVQRPLDTLDTWMYIVRSTGRVIKPTQGADPQAVRTVAQFAEWRRGSVDIVAALTAANGLRDPDGTGEFKGNDQAPSPCNDPNVSAIRTPTGEAPSLPLGYTTTGTSPNVVESGSGPTVANLTKIDWLATTTGGVIPDYTYVRTGDTSYPVMLITGDATLGAAGLTTVGYGTLIVTGKLTTEGNFVQWYGIVLVGGDLHFHAADQRFDGTVVSGLNEQLGLNPLKTHIAGGYVDIDYDSRFVRLATRPFAGFFPVENGWVDNWATY